jgi:hypothetical protein
LADCCWLLFVSFDWLLAVAVVAVICWLIGCWLPGCCWLLAVRQLAVALLLIVGCWLLLLFRCSAVGCWLLADCFVGFVISFLCWLFSCYSVAVAAGG